eukprot:1402828-Rhodomonas_salina.1
MSASDACAMAGSIERDPPLSSPPRFGFGLPVQTRAVPEPRPLASHSLTNRSERSRRVVVMSLPTTCHCSASCRFTASIWSRHAMNLDSVSVALSPFPPSGSQHHRVQTGTHCRSLSCSLANLKPPTRTTSLTP